MAGSHSSVIAGIDTHKDFHVVAVINMLSLVLDTASFPTTRSGYLQAVAWMKGFGTVTAVGVEGTGSYGKGITRVLDDAGLEVVEVIRPNRQTRRRYGKTDRVDAIAAARAVLAGEAAGTPRDSHGPLESIRVLKNSRDQAQKHKTATGNQIWAVIDTAPETIRRQLKGMSLLQVARTVAKYRPRNPAEELDGTKYALKQLGQRWLFLDQEISDTGQVLDPLVKDIAPPELVDETGIGTQTLATLLTVAGSNPDRVATEASFAALCGVSPVEASSGKIIRHRLNRGGDRQANAALYRTVIVRLRYHQPTKEYMAKRIAEGKTKKEVIRCLKRHLARHIYRTIKTHSPSREHAA